ncbi:hypothetical protein L5515_018669 [Caenorhabditis briggsae]|uniref:Uncharacterized protein n=1 Tax=Caenorhabditis briggsae TaxID=6238 RepID=A0AAE9FCW7_CAEBR|nr:hypothetical protein L5515_018669 [Caenorhabditis briggsae]
MDDKNTDDTQSSSMEVGSENSTFSTNKISLQSNSGAENDIEMAGLHGQNAEKAGIENNYILMGVPAIAVVKQSSEFSRFHFDSRAPGNTAIAHTTTTNSQLVPWCNCKNLPRTDPKIAQLSLKVSELEAKIMELTGIVEGKDAQLLQNERMFTNMTQTIPTHVLENELASRNRAVMNQIAGIQEEVENGSSTAGEPSLKSAEFE